MTAVFKEYDVTKQEHVYEDIVTGEKTRVPLKPDIVDKECPICVKRRQALKRLLKVEEYETPFIREKYRTKDLATGEPGEREKLKECCNTEGNIVSSHTVFYYDGQGIQRRAHYHTCEKCGTRHPRKGCYPKDFLDDELDQKDVPQEWKH